MRDILEWIQKRFFVKILAFIPASALQERSSYGVKRLASHSGKVFGISQISNFCNFRCQWFLSTLQRLKASLHLKLKICSVYFLGKTRIKVSKHPKGAFRARKTLWKFGYSVLGHMGALFSNRGLLRKRKQFTWVIASKFGYSVLRQMGAIIFEPTPPAQWKQITSDIASQTREKRIISNLRLLFSEIQFTWVTKRKIWIVMKKISVNIYRENSISENNENFETLIKPKNVKGEPFGFLASMLLQNRKKFSQFQKQIARGIL